MYWAMTLTRLPSISGIWMFRAAAPNASCRRFRGRKPLINYGSNSGGDKKKILPPSFIFTDQTHHSPTILISVQLQDSKVKFHLHEVRKWKKPLPEVNVCLLHPSCLNCKCWPLVLQVATPVSTRFSSQQEHQTVFRILDNCKPALDIFFIIC